ncbi:MAG: sugar phosphate isomerase/epimerase family protein [Armatimonadota bacterium]|nr:sugar phosphate isomerase/epimerase family protein [Armatimonadota bacterium]
MKKAMTLGSMPPEMSLSERFALAAEAGLEGLELTGVESQAEAEEARAAADAAGIEIASVMATSHWRLPLSSTDEAVRVEGVKGVEQSLRVADSAGTDVVLVVPGVVDENTQYHAAMDLATKSIRELLPTAEGLGIVMALENVWNKFLLSPLEMRDFIDQFDSPNVRAYFDVGNILLYGYPVHWIEVLAERIVRVHIKDFNVDTRQFVALLTGSVDYPRVINALRGVGYDGWLTAELARYSQFPEQFVYDTAAHLQCIIDS